MRYHKSLWILLAFLPSCVTRQQHQNLKADLFRVQKRLLHMEEQQGVEGGDLDGVRQQMASGDTRVQEIDETLRMLRGEIDMLKVAVERGGIPGQLPEKDSILFRVNELEAKLNGKVTELKPVSVAKQTPPKAEESLSYAEVNQAFHDKKYEDVIREVPKYFKGSHAKGSRYLRAESLYQLSRWSEAALGFHELLEMKPSEKVLPHVRMRMGDCFEKMGKVDAARVYYQELLQNHAKSKEARIVKKILGRLDKTKKV